MFQLVRSLAAALVAFVAFLPVTSYSQGTTSDLNRIIVPYGPGGLPDVLARLVAQKMSDATGTPYIVENRPGAGGTIAAARAAKATPDGRTILLTDIGIYAFSPVLYPTQAYHPLNDFAPITQAITGPLFLVVNSSLGVSTIQELIALAKKQPGMNYGSIGSGSSHHLAMAQFGRAAGLELTHVPYKGVQQVTPALLGNQIPMMFVTLPSILGSVQAGTLRILAVGSSRRTSLLPDVPTIAESGYPGYEATTNMGFVVPAGTPSSIISSLNEGFVKALNAADVKSKMQSLGMEVVASTPEEFAATIKKDHDHYGPLVRKIGVKIQ